MILKVVELWGKIPGWIKWPFAIIVIPNIVFFGIIFFIYGIPWVDGRIDAKIIPMREQRDLQIKQILEVQQIHNKNMIDGLRRVEQHQGLMYQALLNRQQSNTLTSSDGGR